MLNLSSLYLGLFIHFESINTDATKHLYSRLWLFPNPFCINDDFGNVIYPKVRSY